MAEMEVDIGAGKTTSLDLTVVRDNKEDAGITQKLTALLE